MTERRALRYQNILIDTEKAINELLNLYNCAQMSAGYIIKSMRGNNDGIIELLGTRRMQRGNPVPRNSTIQKTFTYIDFFIILCFRWLTMTGSAGSDARCNLLIGQAGACPYDYLFPNHRQPTHIRLQSLGNMDITFFVLIIFHYRHQGAPYC